MRKCEWCESDLVGREKRNNRYCNSDCHNEFRAAVMDHKIWKGEVNTAGTLRRYKLSKCSSCESCGLDTWNEMPLPLEVHHVDGDPTNNRALNLQLLCPNCHAVTDSWKGKNRGNGRTDRYK